MFYLYAFTTYEQALVSNISEQTNRLQQKKTLMNLIINRLLCSKIVVKTILFDYVF